MTIIHVNYIKLLQLYIILGVDKTSWASHYRRTCLINRQITTRLHFYYFYHSCPTFCPSFQVTWKLPNTSNATLRTNKIQHNKAVWRLTCITCWKPSHSLAHHIQTASPWCEHGHGSWGCTRWGKPFRSPVDCTRTCTRPGVSSGVSAGFPPCCTSLCSLRTCTGSASPERGRRGGRNQRLNKAEKEYPSLNLYFKKLVWKWFVNSSQ